MADPGGSVEPVVITGVGLMTAVGHRAPQAATSLRAGIARMGEYPEYEPIVRDPGMMFPEPAKAAPVTGVTDRLGGIERLFALGVPALHEAIADAGLRGEDLARTALLVAGGQHPEVVEGSRVALVFAPRLASRVAKVPFRLVEYLPRGTAGFLLALKRAFELLGQRACDRCAVGGVDSWLDPDTLRWLDGVRRLKSASNPDGFIPGEAAAFIVIEPRNDAARRQRVSYAQCGPVVEGREERTIWSEDPCTAEALSACLKRTLAGLAKQGARPDVILSDLNGESYRSTEWAYAMSRAFRDGQPLPPVLHPADCIGDVGAAIGGVLIGMAAFAMKHDFVPWRSGLVWCSSDAGERAACALFKA